MIQNIRVKNFKSLKSVSIPLKPLTILGGLNGMGKSSLIQVLLLLRQSRMGTGNHLQLQGQLCNIGKGQDVLYQFASDEDISFHVAWAGNEVEYTFRWDPESPNLTRDRNHLQEEENIDPVVSVQPVTFDWSRIFS